MSRPSLALDDFLCFALHSTAQAVIRANKPMLDRLDLTYPQYLVMGVCVAGSVRGGGGNSGFTRGVGLGWPSDLAARVELRSSHP